MHLRPSTVRVGHAILSRTEEMLSALNIGSLIVKEPGALARVAVGNRDMLLQHAAADCRRVLLLKWMAKTIFNGSSVRLKTKGGRSTKVKKKHFCEHTTQVTSSV